MSVALRSVGSRGTSAPGAPAGAANNDIIVLVVDCNVATAGNNVAAGGFTFQGFGGSGGLTGRGVAFLTKRSTGAEPANYAVTNPTGGSISASEAYAFSGVTTNGVYVTAPVIVGLAAGGTTTPTGVGITDAAGDKRVFAFVTSGGSVTVAAPPSGFTEISPTTASIMHTLAQDSPGGASGDLVATMSATSNPKAAGVISLIADTGGGPPPTTDTTHLKDLAEVVSAGLPAKYKGSDQSVVAATLYYKAADGSVTAL